MNRRYGTSNDHLFKRRNPGQPSRDEAIAAAEDRARAYETRGKKTDPTIETLVTQIVARDIAAGVELARSIGQVHRPAIKEMNMPTRDLPAAPVRAVGSIFCPVCGGETSVTETRSYDGQIRRRRRCDAPGCGGRITTIEMAVYGTRRGVKLVGDTIMIKRALLDNLRTARDEIDLVLRGEGDED